MNGMNECIHIGTVGAEPKIRTTKGGIKIAEFSLAVNKSIRKENEWQTITTWIAYKAWSKMAERVEKQVHKGYHLAVISEFTEEKWTDEDGNPKSRPMFVIERLQTVGKPENKGGSYTNNQAEPQAQGANQDEDSFDWE